MWANPLYIINKGVAALALETNLKWLGRTREGAHVFLFTCFCDKETL